MTNVTFQLSKTKAQKWSLGFSKSPIHRWYQVYVSYLQRRAESTTNTHNTQNHVRYGITYLVLVRYSSSYLLVLLCTTTKTGGGRATEGERCMYTANTAAALPVVIDYIHISRTTWCISVLVLLCTTYTSGSGREKVGERRRASDIYVCTQQYSSICSSIYIFSVYPYDVCTTNTSVGGRAKGGERYVCTQQYQVQ